MAEKVSGIIGILCLALVWYSSVIKYFLLKLRCSEMINAKVESVSVRYNKRRRHETLTCTYAYGGETYTSKLQSPDKVFSETKGSDIYVMINPNKPTEILQLTRLSYIRFAYNSIFILIIMSMFSGIAFGAGDGLFKVFFSLLLNDFLVRIGNILLGLLISTLCILGFKVLIIGPFIAKYTDKEITGVLYNIEVQKGNTYEGKEWKSLEYKYTFDDKQYIFTASTTDDVKEGDLIKLKVNSRKPHKAYEPYSDPMFIKLISGVVMGVFLCWGISLILPSFTFPPSFNKVESIYGSNFEDNMVDASEEYLSGCNRIEVKKNVTLYIPKEYTELYKNSSGCGYQGTKESQQIGISIEKNKYSLDHVYSELIKSMNKYEKVIGEEKEYIYNNNKYLVYEIDRKDKGLDRANYVITANGAYYIGIIIGWEDDEADPTENILSSLEY